MYYHDPAMQAEIRRRAREGRIIITDHCRVREEDRDIEDIEIHRCLKNGVLEGEDWNPQYQDTTYRMGLKQGLTTTLVVVVALSDTHDIAVTVFRREKR